MKFEKEKYTPMMRQYLTIKEDFVEELLFFRLGDFYELFFEDAIKASQALEIQLTGRDAGVKEKVPMCGVPFHAVDPYIEKLVNLGYKVAICEQVSEPLQKDIVRREVKRVVTPGTNITSVSLDKSNNIYIASLYLSKDRFVYMVYLDITTGETSVVRFDFDYQVVANEVIKLGVKELVISPNINVDKLKKCFFGNDILINRKSDLNLAVEVADLSRNLNEDETKAYALLCNYLINTQKRNLSHLQEVKPVNNQMKMMLDRFTVKNLELVENNKTNEKKSSLFWYLDKTSTAFGSRLLRRSIISPSTSMSEIINRQEIVNYLIEDYVVKDEILKLLKTVYDLERITGKIGYGTVNPVDLDNLKHSINSFVRLKELKEIITNSYLLELIDQIDDVKDLSDLLNSAINDNPPISVKDKMVIKDGFNERLDELRHIERNQQDYLLKLEQEEREKTGIKSLKICYNRVFGYYFEILKSQTHLVKDEFAYIRKQTLSNCERYINAELKDKEIIIFNATNEQMKIESELFQEVKEKTVEYIKIIQKNARIIALIDMLTAFSVVSEENDLTRPVFNNDNIIDLKDARHPVLEKIISKDYVKNDLYMSDYTQALIITGPNMSGKSSFMRMIADIIIMAQIGSNVPASYCNIKLFDKIFTRIGASDDLVSGQSTFMVEMLEVNYALSNATKDSFIILDEVGRGTATYDGVALANSILEYIATTVGAKTLFSTHYHELVSLEQYLGNVKNMHIEAKEVNNTVIFYHKLKDGPIDKSYGINVASLAKLPKQVIKRAKSILKELESKNASHDLFAILNQSPSFEDETVIENEDIKYIEELKNIDIDEFSPLDSLNYLANLIKRIKDENS